MKFKGTTVLLLVFLGLGLYVYLTEIRGREEREQQEEAAKRALQVEGSQITEINLVYPDRTITGVKQGERQWEITNPAGIEADPDEWEQLASNISRIERQQTVTEDGADLAAFGLDEPPLKVAAKLDDGSTVEVAFGNENPGRTYNYAKLNSSSEIFLTPTSWKGLFTKTVNDLRNKKILQFESDGDIDAVRIAEASRELEFEKSGEDWLLKKPIETSADNSEVTAFISSIRFARASSFAEPTVTAQTAGLNPPALRIVLHDAKANADRILLVGKSPEADRYYVQDSSRDVIYIADKDVPEKARRPVFDWRDKSITHIQRDRIDQVELRAGSDGFSFKKVDADWKLPDDRKLQFDKVSNMLTSLEFDKVIDIIDSPAALSSYGLDQPKLEAVFREGNNELLRLAFGSDSEQPEGVYIKTSERPAVEVVAKDVVDKFSLQVDDLLEQDTSSQ